MWTSMGPVGCGPTHYDSSYNDGSVPHYHNYSPYVQVHLAFQSEMQDAGGYGWEGHNEGGKR